MKAIAFFYHDSTDCFLQLRDCTSGSRRNVLFDNVTELSEYCQSNNINLRLSDCVTV